MRKLMLLLVSSVFTFLMLKSYADSPVATGSPSVTVTDVSAAGASAPTPGIKPAITATLVAHAAGALAPKLEAMPQGSQLAKIIGLFVAFNVLLSGLRDLCAKFDGVAPGAAAPPEDKVLTILNKACLLLGKLLDYVMANVQH